MSRFATPAGVAVREGTVVRDGVRLAFAVHGGPRPDAPTVVLLPTWSIVPSRFWKAQVPFLARHFRVVTFDGRGSGSSDRPVGAEAYSDSEYAADALAVLDAVPVEQAVLVGESRGVSWAVHVAARAPERVGGIVAVAAAVDLADLEQERDIWSAQLSRHDGWQRYNKAYWLDGGYNDFVGFFFRTMFPEPHSTKQIEDCVGWAHEVTPALLADTTSGRLGADGARSQGPLDDLCTAASCPVLVLHGTEDGIRPAATGRRLAELTGGELVLMQGSGHGPSARDPVEVNLRIKDFVDRVHPPPRPAASWRRARDRARRVLYLSSPIGLGHARRDLAIAGELRRLIPGLEVDWLAQHPVTRVLDQAGESVHPASRWLASESAHIEAECGEHDLHAFQAIRRMDAILVANFMVFTEVLQDGHYDMVVGDEAWDVDYFLHENPRLKQAPFAWMTDFVGWLPMPEGGAAEAALTADYNAEMLEQRDRYRWVRDRSVFVGSPEDIVPDSFGPGLPVIREWTCRTFDFAGYVTGYEPPDEAERGRLRHTLGYRDDERLCVVTVGGSGVGTSLLRRALDAVPLLRREAPDLRVLVVTGPRIDPATLPVPDGATVVGYLPDLTSHLSVCDVAMVQGGLTTCMELTAARRPFVYVPLRGHFEQNLHVRHRLDGYGAGTCLDYETACDPESLAHVILTELTRVVDYKPVESDGAARAAALLADLL